MKDVSVLTAAGLCMDDTDINVYTHKKNYLWICSHFNSAYVYKNSHFKIHSNDSAFWIQSNQMKDPLFRWFGLCWCGLYYTQLPRQLFSPFIPSSSSFIFILKLTHFWANYTRYIYVCSLFHGPSHFKHAIRAEVGVTDVHIYLTWLLSSLCILNSIYNYFSIKKKDDRILTFFRRPFNFCGQIADLPGL